MPKAESAGGVGGAIQDFAIGATHHLANLPLGVNQLLWHGANAAANAIAPNSSIAQQIG